MAEQNYAEYANRDGNTGKRPDIAFFNFFIGISGSRQRFILHHADIGMNFFLYHIDSLQHGLSNRRGCCFSFFDFILQFVNG